MRFSLPQKKIDAKNVSINVLIIGNDYHDSLEVSYYNSLKKLGFSPHIISLNKIYEKISYKIYNKIFKISSQFRLKYPYIKINDLDQKYFQQRYDLVIFFSITSISKEVLLKFKDCTKNLYFIFADNPLYKQYKQYEMLNNAKIFDYVFLWSEKLVNEFKRYNKNCIFLDFAWDLNTFPNSIKNKSASNKLIFIGGWDKYREKHIKFLKKTGVGINIYGPSVYWSKINDFKKIYKYEIRSSEASNLICNNINLNLQREQNNFAEGLNMRVYETLGSGGILITKKIEGLKKISVDLYDNHTYEELNQIPTIYENMLTNINYYNESNKELFEHIKKNHTYLNRAYEIIKCMSN
jgi:spore maturation protein CgeB